MFLYHIERKVYAFNPILMRIALIQPIITIYLNPNNPHMNESPPTIPHKVPVLCTSLLRCSRTGECVIELD